MENEIIIIRPSGVWDTRAPFYYFTNFHKQENKIFWTLVVGLDYLQNEWNKIDKQSDVDVLLEDRRISGKLQLSWNSYKKSLHVNPQNTNESPKMEQAIDTLSIVKNNICSRSIIKYIESFETYIQCWYLNFILTKLEKNEELSDCEKNHIDLFNPLKRFRLPSIFELCKKTPEILNILKKQPHIFVDPKTNKEVSVPITEQLNAFEVINFWKDIRNLIIHRGGIVNSDFIRRYETLWRDLNLVFPHMYEIKKGQFIRLDENSFRAVSTVFYKAAKSLKEFLVEFSNGKRGHVLAPASPTTDGKVSKDLLPMEPPKLLINGDHALSYRWIIDKEFQSEMYKKFTNRKNKK